MKAPILFLGITLAIYLALPETTGAPSCGCDKGKLISASVAKESSKSSEKFTQEEKESKDSKARASNGLISGAKSMSVSRQLSNTEEEQSKLAAQKTTTTGSESVEEATRKKKVVSVNEKKTLVVYYLVSYKKLPVRGKNECLKEYYLRIFPKEANLHVFYRKIFKAYECEDPQSYIDRVEYILTQVYPELDCRLDIEWLEQFDHYYTIKYSRKEDECDDSYFPRVLKKLPGECKEDYKKRMQCLVAALDEEDFTHITFDDSEIGYKIGVRKTPAKSRSGPASITEKTGQISESTKRSREVAEEVDKSESSIEQSNKKGSSAEYEKKLKKKKVAVEKEENTKAFTYRVAYTALPKRCQGESLETYYLKFFGNYDTSMSADVRNELYLRILIQYKGELAKAYVERIDFLFDKVYPELDIRTNTVLITLLDHYYREKYAKELRETDEQWFGRVLTKKCGETAENYKNRVLCMQTVLTEIQWNKVVIDENSEVGYKLVTAETKCN